MQKAHNKLGWEPETSLEDLIEEMIESDKIKAHEELILQKKDLR